MPSIRFVNYSCQPSQRQLFSIRGWLFIDTSHAFRTTGFWHEHGLVHAWKPPPNSTGHISSIDPSSSRLIVLFRSLTGKGMHVLCRVIRCDRDGPKRKTVPRYCLDILLSKRITKIQLPKGRELTSNLVQHSAQSFINKVAYPGGPRQPHTPYGSP